MEQSQFRSGTNLAKITRILLLLTAIFNGIFVFLRGIEYLLFSTAQIGANSDHLIFSSLLGLFSLGVVLLSYATPVVFLMWQYRAAKNLLFMNESALSNSPFSNVGWWFVPLASLVMPLQCINELLNGSRHENALNRNYSADSSLSNLTGLWWFFYIVAGIVGLGVAFLSFRLIKEPELLSNLVIFMVLSHSFSITAAFLVRKVILLIDNFQEESYKLFCERHNVLNPPSPPEFN